MEKFNFKQNKGKTLFSGNKKEIKNFNIFNPICSDIYLNREQLETGKIKNYLKFYDKNKYADLSMHARPDIYCQTGILNTTSKTHRYLPVENKNN